MRLGVAPFRILFGLVWFGIAKNSEIFFSLYFRGRIFFPEILFRYCFGCREIGFRCPSFRVSLAPRGLPALRGLFDAPTFRQTDFHFKFALLGLPSLPVAIHQV
jgi:hypothetical protein